MMSQGRQLLLFLFLFTTLIGCSSPGTIYLVAPSISPQEQQRIVNILKETGKQVEISPAGIPELMTDNTVLLPFIVQDHQQVELLTLLLAEHGYPIKQVLMHDHTYNHKYSANNFGVYLIKER